MDDRSGVWGRSWPLAVLPRSDCAGGVGTAIGCENVRDARFHAGIVAQGGLYRNGHTSHLRGHQRAGSIANVHGYRRREAHAQRMRLELSRVERDAYRYALHDLDPITGSVLRRQQRKGAAAARRYAHKLAVIFNAA